MKTTWSLALCICCCLIVVSGTAAAQATIEGRWHLKNAQHNLSLFFRDDHVFSIRIDTSAKGNDPVLIRMGTYTVTGKQIKVRWSISEFDTWTIQQLTKSTLKLNISIKSKGIQLRQVLLLRPKEEESIAASF